MSREGDTQDEINYLGTSAWINLMVSRMTRVSMGTVCQAVGNKVYSPTPTISLPMDVGKSDSPTCFLLK